MRILAIDMGTGTQDILLFDTTTAPENSIKMVLPSATEIAARQIRAAAGRPLLLTGVTMGGGPCQWALEEHLRAGGTAFATPDAARTFDDDLAVVAGLGVAIISDDEAVKLHNVERITLRDLDLEAVRTAFAAFCVPPAIDGLALGCLDHGNAPPGYSDRLFRFNHLKAVVRERNDLTSFAFLPDEVPEYLTRARSMIVSADVDVPTVFLDTGPAAALGALQDPRVQAHEEALVVNLGNMHALAFYLRGTYIHALFEHHTGLLQPERIEGMIAELARGTLSHDEVYATNGHGVFYADDYRPSELPFVAVTGPQRGKLRDSSLRPYFAAPHGDMMISGCFGLVRAFAERFPDARDAIDAALAQSV
jgi:uncharacterized protein (DUF1786 family)